MVFGPHAVEPAPLGVTPLGVDAPLVRSSVSRPHLGERRGTRERWGPPCHQLVPGWTFTDPWAPAAVSALWGFLVSTRHRLILEPLGGGNSFVNTCC
jgi:hypothetical protein